MGLNFYNTHCLIIDTENIYRASQYQGYNYYEYYINTLVSNHYYKYGENTQICIFSISKRNFKYDTIVPNAMNTITINSYPIQYYYCEIILNNMSQQDRQLGREIHKQVNNDGAEEKNDIDDCAIIYLYIYILFLQNNNNCYIISNDSYKWFSLPIKKINITFNDQNIYTNYVLSFSPSCSNKINDLYNKYLPNDSLLYNELKQSLFSYESIILEDTYIYDKELDHFIEYIIGYFA